MKNSENVRIYEQRGIKIAREWYVASRRDGIYEVHYIDYEKGTKKRKFYETEHGMKIATSRFMG